MHTFIICHSMPFTDVRITDNNQLWNRINKVYESANKKEDKF